MPSADTSNLTNANNLPAPNFNDLKNTAYGKVLDLADLKREGNGIRKDIKTQEGGEGYFLLESSQATFSITEPIDGGKGGVVNADITWKFPQPIANFLTKLESIKLNVGDGKGGKLSLGKFIGEAYGRISSFGVGIVTGIIGLIGDIKSGNVAGIVGGVFKTIGNIVGMALPGVGAIIGKVIGFFTGLFGGKRQKSPEEMISEQISGLHKAMAKSFNMVFDNQRLILKNLSAGFLDISSKIKLDGQLTRNAIADLSMKLDRKTELIIDQIENLRVEMSNSFYGLQSSLDMNFGFLSLQMANSFSNLRRELGDGFNTNQFFKIAH